MIRELGDNGGLKSATDQPLERINEVLLVDDSPAAARLIIESLKDGLREYRVTVIEDGETALALLRREGMYATADRPDLILLDLNLPKMNGHEVLATLKADPALRSIPVVILTTSQVEEDKILSYWLGAERFLVKPGTWEEYQQLGETIAVYFARTDPLAQKRVAVTTSAKSLLGVRVSHRPE